MVAPARLVAEKPEAASWAEAAAFPVPALTADQVVSEALAVEPGETVLVNGVLAYHDPAWRSAAIGVAGGAVVLEAREGVTLDGASHAAAIRSRR